MGGEAKVADGVVPSALVKAVCKRCSADSIPRDFMLYAYSSVLLYLPGKRFPP